MTTVSLSRQQLDYDKPQHQLIIRRIKRAMVELISPTNKLKQYTRSMFHAR